MGRPHTTIGAERFHFRVRKGIGWYPLAIAARKTGIAYSFRALSNLEISDNLRFGTYPEAFHVAYNFSSHYMSHTSQNALALYDQASRAISTG